MLVRATEPGFFNRYIETGEIFDVPKGTKWPWIVPVKPDTDTADAATGTDAGTATDAATA